MNVRSVVGVLLIAIGGLALAYQQVSYQKRETVLDIGPIQATAETTETIPIPAWAGGLVLMAGVVVLISGLRRRS